MTNWTRFYIAYYVYRCVLSILGQAVVSRFTLLGDSKQFQRGAGKIDGLWFLDSNAITANIGTVFRTIFLGNAILINIGFQSIAFCGLYMLLQSVDSDIRKRLVLLLLFPSFNLWSSVAGKEAVLVFALGILGAFIVDLYRNRGGVRLSLPLAGYLVFVYKTHYIPALLYLVIVTIFTRYFRQKALLAIIFGGFSLFPLYLFREKIDNLAFSILPHFIGFGHSTRGAFWVEQYDVFYKAPYGMFVSFFGPTLGEALEARHLLQVVSFLESAVMVVLLVVYLIDRLPKLPIYNFVVIIFSSFWILFVNYPVGVMNPGSAVRYRAGYVVFIFLLFTLLMSRNVFVQWRVGRKPLVERKDVTTSASE